MKSLFFISIVSCLPLLAAESNSVSNCKNNCSSNNFVKQETHLSIESEEKKISGTLQNGTLRQIADQNNPRSYKIENGKKIILHNKKGRRTGIAKSYKNIDGTTSIFIRDCNGNKVGKARTYFLKNGLKKTVLRDKNNNKIGSISKVGGHTVYRNAKGKRVSRRKARSLGLR